MAVRHARRGRVAGRRQHGFGSLGHDADLTLGFAAQLAFAAVGDRCDHGPPRLKRDRKTAEPTIE